MGKRLGKIKISRNLFLKWIDYTDAELREARYDYPSDSIELLLESNEFPEKEINGEPPIISPIYIQYQDAIGNRITLRKRD